MESPGYSLDKYRKAPEVSLTPEEQSFLEDWSSRFDELSDKADWQRPLLSILQITFRPEAWRIAAETKKADLISAKGMESKDGLMAQAHAEADAWNAEYDRKANAVAEAIKEYTDFTDALNERNR
jgi:hypothetical protein